MACSKKLIWRIQGKWAGVQTGMVGRRSSEGNWQGLTAQLKNNKDGGLSYRISAVATHC